MILFRLRNIFSKNCKRNSIFVKIDKMQIFREEMLYLAVALLMQVSTITSSSLTDTPFTTIPVDIATFTEYHEIDQSWSTLCVIYALRYGSQVTCERDGRCLVYTGDTASLTGPNTDGWTCRKQGTW